jgi:hypothetical protein
MVCLLCAGAACAQQEQPAVGSNGASAAVPRLIKFSGRVLDARGEPLGSVAVRLTFAVYEEQTGGAALWAETQMAELDEQGRYSVLLGATRSDGLPVELFPAGKARWLGVQVEGRDEDPRVLLVSVPYALKAEDAAMLGGRRASDFVLSEQLKEEVRTQVEAQKPGITAQAVEMLVNNPSHLPALTEDLPSVFTCATSGDCVTATQSSTGRALKATATSASEAALLQQNGTGYGLRVLSQSNYAIYGVVQGAVVGTTYGVRGLVNSTTGAGILGSNTATTGIAYGLMGQTSSVSGIGLFGRALATTGTTTGLGGDADSTSGKGIMGRATATSGTTTGIYAEARSASGTALVVNNTAGGKLVSAQANGVEKFSVSNAGNVLTSGSVTAASFAGSGSGLTTLNASNLSTGTVPSARISGTYSVAVTFSNASNSFTGSGAGLTNLNASNLASGTVPSARISGTYSNAVTFSNATNVFVGDGSGLTNVPGGGGTATDLNCSSPCVSPSEVSFNYAGSSSQGGAAANALQLGGVAASNYARLDIGNAFTGDQTIDGAFFVVGAGGKIPLQVQQFAGSAKADGWITYSSGRWKTNIQTLAGALEKVERLRGVSYDRKADGKHEIGVIAEEVGQVVPQVVAYEENGVDAQGVDYSRLTAVLIEAVKEQQIQIRALKAEIEQLRTTLRGGTGTAGR